MWLTVGRPNLVESACPLAALRIAVSIIILLSPELRHARELASDPFALDVIPEGLGVLSKIPISPGAARLLELCAISSAATGLLGYGSRVSMLVLTLSGGLAFSLSQRSGAVIHDMHLFWFTALLSACRCGDVWALDAWGRPRPAASIRYGVPAACARGLLGLIYFFPGLHKLRESGLSWLTTENMVNQLHTKWFEFGRLPFVRVDRFPELCRAGAWFVVVFELSFVLLVQVPRTRLLALVFGLGFHLATDVFLFIRFPSLWGCYVLLLPFESIARRFWPDRAGDERSLNTDRWPWLALCVGCGLLLAEGVQGLRAKTQAWPFACYPTFAQVPGRTIVDLRFEVEHPGGHLEAFTGREQQARTQFEWRRVFYLAGAYGTPVSAAARLDFARKMAKRAGVELESGARLALFRVDYLTDPDTWGRAPLRATRLFDCRFSLQAAEELQESGSHAVRAH